MASSSSSTKKAAKLAQKGQGRTVRFQGGTLFPAIVAAVLILGLGLVVYARQTLPAADDSPPTINDHWHFAYGFYLCDTWYQLEGNLEERDSRGQFTNTNFLRSGIHSHDDGVVHWHPYTSKAVGSNAVLGVFLESYDVELEDDKISFPDNNILGGQQVWEEGETECNGEDAEVTVKAWNSFTDTDSGNRFIANMDEVRFENDGMVIAVYFTADDEPQVMPPWAEQLPTLGAADSAQIRPEDLLQGDTSVVLGSVPADEATTEETSSDEATTEETSSDEPTTEETSSDETTTEETTNEETTSDDSSDG